MQRHSGTAAGRDASRFPLPAALTILLISLAAAPLTAQTPQQLELLRNNPDLVRQRLAQSGLSADEIRSRLQQAGYSSSLLDPFLTGEPGVASQAAVDARMLQALDALGVPFVQAEGLEPVTTAVGMQPTAGGAAGAGLQLFGLSVFQGRTSQFQPLLSGPVPSNYRVGPGDEMVLVITGDVELVHELTVTREGFIVIPQVGQISVNGLTMDDLTALLRRRLGQSYSGIRTGTTRFDITVSRLRTNQVFVVGEVTQPGAYQLASVATVLNGLYAAGGPTALGNFRDVLVRRQGDTVAVLDLYDYLLSGDTHNDVILEQGDVVFVPLRQQRVSITGAVVRPAIYEIKASERLNDLIAMAGGFRPEAELTRVTVHRILPAAQRGPGPVPRVALDVPLQVTTAGPNDTSAVIVPAFSLEPGDSVAVDAILPRDDALYVSVFGMVKKAGRYPWSQGMTLRDLVRLAGGPTVGADLREAEMARLPAERSRGDLAETFKVPLDSSYLFERDSLGRYSGPPGIVFPAAGSAPDVRLVPFDQATVFRQPEFELQRSVHIVGEVAYPGTYALTSKDERVSDLVTRSGGLLPTAYAAGARFVRQVRGAGRVAIDLEQILQQPGGRRDVILQPGDSLEIPEYIPTVRVEGAVVAATSVLYREGAELDYYVENAGGYARNADKGRVSVRYANGSAQVRRHFLFFGTTPVPGPGSVVNVSAKPEAEPLNVTQFFSSVAQIVASLVAIVVVATR